MSVEPDLESLRLAVYRAYARAGRAPSNDVLAQGLGIDIAGVEAGLSALAAARHVVLDAEGHIVLAHPFASIPLGFSVMGTGTLWWGGCAWDAFALPHLITSEPDALVATRCPACDRPLSWVVSRDGPPPGPEVAHFLVPMAHVWDDVVRACGNQRLFCDGRCVDAWLERTGHELGYVMDLAILWRLARGWYAGRLDRGYVRRDPSAASAYFRDAGLKGPFWGL